MATPRKIEVEKPSDLETRMRYANDIIKVLNGYIQQQGEIDQGSLVFAECAIKLYRTTQVASSSTQTLRGQLLDLIHISEPTRRTPISYAVFCLKKKKNKN